MSFIGRGECRNCGCGEYVKPLDGQKCYHCNHDVDVHLVKYKPQTTTSTPTRKTHSLSVQNTMDGATIDVSQMHSGETFKQGAPDICFEETRQVREPYVRTQGHFVKPQDKVSIISKQISSVTRKDEDAGHSEDMAVCIDTNKDKRGVVRGRCKDCPEDCLEYSQPVHRHNCTYCGCPAGQHERVEPRPERIIKTEPGEEEAGSPGQSNGGPTPGPSRRPGGLTTDRGRPGPSRRYESPNNSTTHRGQSRPVSQKRCKQLFESEGIAYSQLKRHLSATEHGVFTILWKEEIIYVGNPKKTPMLSNIRSIFTGGNTQDIGKYLKSLPKDLVRQHARVAWLKHIDDDPHRRTCREGYKILSYQQCLSKLQRRKPRDALKHLMQSTVGR
ncbi:uncharacterized protein [Haliotis asinina]|uniref:uncharacterized protein isoform X2 n=1 Tax=Haliotis asinina TaxID=109174 RepID=UPI003531E931